MIIFKAVNKVNEPQFNKTFSTIKLLLSVAA